VTLKADIVTHATSVLLNTDHFAEIGIRWILGDNTDTEEVTGLWKDESPDKTDDRGRDFLNRGTFHFAGTQEMTIRDALYIRDLQYEIEKVTEEPSQGLKTAWCVRRTSDTRGARIARGY